MNRKPNICAYMLIIDQGSQGSYELVKTSLQLYCCPFRYGLFCGLVIKIGSGINYIALYKAAGVMIKPKLKFVEPLLLYADHILSE